MNLYDILGIKRGARPDEVKRAYRRKAQSVHPDKGGTAEGFAELNRAYQTLSDERLREEYDRTGTNERPRSDIEIILNDLAGLLLNVVVAEGPDIGRVNIVAKAQELIRNTNKQHYVNIGNGEEQIAKLRKALAKLHWKGQGQDYVAGIFQGSIRTTEGQLRSLRETIARNEKMIAMLGEYTFDTDEFDNDDLPTGFYQLKNPSLRLRNPGAQR